MFVQQINRLSIFPNMKDKKQTERIGIRFEGHRRLMELVDTDFYTGKIVEKTKRSTEHILPKSKRGRNRIENYAMVDKDVNRARSNKDLRQWLKEHPDFVDNMKNYVKKYWDLLIDGKKHGEEVSKTVKKISGLDLTA